MTLTPEAKRRIADEYAKVFIAYAEIVERLASAKVPQDAWNLVPAARRLRGKE